MTNCFFKIKIPVTKQNNGVAKLLTVEMTLKGAFEGVNELLKIVVDKWGTEAIE